MTVASPSRPPLLSIPSPPADMPMPKSLRLLAASAAAVLLAACATGTRTAATVGGTQNAVPSASQTAIANAIDVMNAPFIASKKSKKYYPARCSTVKLINTADQVGFASIKDAETAGFSKDLYSTDCQY
jgi:hypothetical protein